MKKLLLTVICLAVALGASAKFRWGPVVTADFSHYHWHQRLISNKMLVGGGVGVIGEVMIPGIGFGFDFGLKYMNHGGQVGFDEQYIWSSEGIGKTNLRMSVIQIPVNVRFKYTRLNGVENVVAPFVYGGPEFNLNVGNAHCEAVRRETVSVALGCGLGAELYKRYQVSGGYYWDMTDDMKTRKLDNFTARLQGWRVNFAVLF